MYPFSIFLNAFKIFEKHLIPVVRMRQYLYFNQDRKIIRAKDYLSRSFGPVYYQKYLYSPRRLLQYFIILTYDDFFYLDTIIIYSQSSIVLGSKIKQLTIKYNKKNQKIIVYTKKRKDFIVDLKKSAKVFIQRFILKHSDSIKEYLYNPDRENFKDFYYKKLNGGSALKSKTTYDYYYYNLSLLQSTTN